MSIRFQQRDIAIFRFLGLNCFITIEILRRRFFRGSKDAAESWKKRMNEAGYILSHDLDGSHVYYYLSPKAIQFVRKKVDAPVIRQAAIKPAQRSTIAKVRRFALLCFCTPPQGPLRTPIRPCDYPDEFKDVARELAVTGKNPLPQLLFYRDADGVIGFLEVDNQKSSFIDDKVAIPVKSLSLRTESFAPLMGAGQFRITIVAATRGRKKHLSDKLTEMLKKSRFPNENAAVVYIKEVGKVIPKKNRRHHPNRRRNDEKANHGKTARSR